MYDIYFLNCLVWGLKFNFYCVLWVFGRKGDLKVKMWFMFMGILIWGGNGVDGRVIICFGI